MIATGKVDPDTLPDTVTKARTMPQLDVLEHADVFITHAGMGGANEALWYGVPVVAAPQAVDQFARRHARGLGCGRAAGGADRNRSGGEGARVRRRARELREQVRAQGGVDKAADAVERLTRR